jgi:4-alpha-glucanotransferase
MDMTRSSGLLLHPGSLPGRYGIGTLGREARAFADFLAGAEVGYWQILPLGPVGFGDSPFFIDPDELVTEGLLRPAEAEAFRMPDCGRIEYGRLHREREALLDLAWRRSGADGTGSALEWGEFREFQKSAAWWLEDFALFAAIKEDCGAKAWSRWPEALRHRDPAALEAFRDRAADRIGRNRFTQFLFHRQWQALRRHANAQGVKIIGDIPIFTAPDSADLWSRPELYLLDASGFPSKVAGVPPDYFTATGQLWGNPLYDWEAHRREGFAWWIWRIRASLERADVVRIDHFRGFVDFWAVPAGDRTAEHGIWEKGPGLDLFRAVEAALGSLPIIAEDLGFMTEDVHEVRDSMGFPGMRILQFAFESEGDNGDYPHHYPERSVVYTGTHDNQTARGWIEEAAASRPAQAARARAYLGCGTKDFADRLIRTAWASASFLAVAPMQDFLNLGAEARMNHPGSMGGWWSWRMKPGDASPALMRRIRKLNRAYFRS